MADPELREIAEAVKALQQKLELLSTPLEEILTNRVVQHTKRQITHWITAYFIIAVSVLAYLGFSVNTFLQTVSDQVKERATVKIQEVVVATVTPQVQTALSSKADAMVAEAAAQADDALLKFEQRLTEALKRKDPAIAQALETRPKSSPVPAFAYYGQQLPNGTWAERYFRSSRMGEDQSFPQPGVDVIAIGHVNARKDYIQCSPAQGCVNAPLEPSVGVIRPNDRLELLDSKVVHDGFVWIKFRRRL